MYQVNIIKEIKKGCKKKQVKGIKIFLKKKKQQYVFSEDKKQKLVEYSQKCYRMRKNALLKL